MKRLTAGAVCATFLAVAQSGCATSGVATQSAAEPVARVQDGSEGVSYELGVRGVSHRTELNAPPERAWDALVQTYVALGINANFMDPANRRYGVQRYTGSQLAGRRTSDLVRCSEGAGPSAVVGRRIEMSVLSTLRPLPSGGTALETEVTGVARRMDGTSTPPVRCESSGELEQRLAAAVREQLSR